MKYSWHSSIPVLQWIASKMHVCWNTHANVTQPAAWYSCSSSGSQVFPEEKSIWLAQTSARVAALSAARLQVVFPFHTSTASCYESPPFSPQTKPPSHKPSLHHSSSFNQTPRDSPAHVPPSTASQRPPAGTWLSAATLLLIRECKKVLTVSVNLSYFNYQ